MAQSSAYCNPCQNSHNGKDELAGGTPTEDSDRCTPAPTATRAFTPAVTPVIARLVASGSADLSRVRYLMMTSNRLSRPSLKSDFFFSRLLHLFRLMLLPLLRTMDAYVSGL